MNVVVVAEAYRDPAIGPVRTAQELHIIADRSLTSCCSIRRSVVFVVVNVFVSVFVVVRKHRRTQTKSNQDSHRKTRTKFIIARQDKDAPTERCTAQR